MTTYAVSRTALEQALPVSSAAVLLAVSLLLIMLSVATAVHEPASRWDALATGVVAMAMMTVASLRLRAAG